MPILPTPERLARFAVRYPWPVVATWGVLLVVAMAFATTVGSVLTTEAKNTVDTESSRAEALLDARLWGETPGNETIVVQSADRTVSDPVFESLVRDLTDEVRALTGDVAFVTNAFEAPGSVPVSADGKTTLLPVTLVGRAAESDAHVEHLMEILAARDGRDGFTVVTVGDGSVSSVFTRQSEKDLQKAEVIGIPVAVIILAVVFGALVAAGLPLLLGVVAIIVAVGLSAIVGRAFELSVFVINFITTMGLAVGIDYALLIIKRVREERAHGLARDEAIVHAGATASRAVLFSGMAVIVALLGLMIVPNSIFRSMGFGAILVVGAAILAALTLLPALLRLLGDRINAGRLRIPGLRRRSSEGRFWERATGLVMGHPWLSVSLATGLLVAAALPLATIKLGWNGVSTLPADSAPRRAFEILDREFSAGVAAPAWVVISAGDVRAGEVQAATDRFLESLAGDPRFAEATVEVNGTGDLALLSVPIHGDPNNGAARAAVRDLRERYIPGAFAGVRAEVLVGGQTAAGADDTGVIASYTVPVFAFVLSLSFVILLVVFRSIVVPLKAIVMNLLSVGASYGLIVLVFLHGVGNEIFGFSQVERVETWIPLFLFAVIFGLSMDYHVFLLTRIRERFDHTHDNAESVAFGVRSTAGMITGAAAIMVAVFAGFAAGDTVAMQQMGFGLAVAVLLDATVVRVVLVPAAMELLGDRNWYMPNWLGWLPRVDVEGAGVPRPVRELAGGMAGGE